MKWILYTRLGQWLSVLFTGWCFIRKDDKRFVVTQDNYGFPYDGDPSAAPDRGIGNQRNAWKQWIIFQMPSGDFSRFVVIDIYDGRRLACFKESKKALFAIRVGHEPGTVRIGARVGKYVSTDRELWPTFISCWREGQSWPLGEVVLKKDVAFI